MDEYEELKMANPPRNNYYRIAPLQKNSPKVKLPPYEA